MLELDNSQFATELDDANQAHLEWSRRILRCAVLRTSPGEDVWKDDAHELCRFGRWFTQHRGRFTAIDATRTVSLDAEHRSMHGAIRAICSCLMDGRVGEAADLDAFETAQHRFIDHLACWRRPKTDPLIEVMPIQN